MITALAIGMPGVPELIIIFAIILVIFGGSRIAGIGKSFGEGISEFKRAMKDDDSSDAEKSSGSDTTANTTNTTESNHQA